jgi:CxxC-x17-CxxC domain-containing protein
MPFADKALKCKDCNEDFIFTSKQQEHHAKLGLRNEPKRCMICRQVARMRNDDRRGGPRPPRRFGPPGDGHGPGPRPAGPGGFREGPREVFIATCAACNKQTDLPFKPRGDRPVYCRDCFRKQPR